MALCIKARQQIIIQHFRWYLRRNSIATISKTTVPFVADAKPAGCSKLDFNWLLKHAVSSHTCLAKLMLLFPLSTQNNIYFTTHTIFLTIYHTHHNNYRSPDFKLVLSHAGEPHWLYMSQHDLMLRLHRRHTFSTIYQCESAELPCPNSLYHLIHKTCLHTRLLYWDLISLTFCGSNAGVPRLTCTHRGLCSRVLCREHPGFDSCLCRREKSRGPSVII